MSLSSSNRPPAGLGKPKGGRRTPHLIGHHTQLLPFSQQAQHREAEVAPHRAIDPAGAQGPCAAVAKSSGFTSRLGAAVDPKGIGSLLKAIGGPLLAVEDKVGAQLQQPAAVIGLGFGQGIGAKAFTAWASSASDSARSTAV